MKITSRALLCASLIIISFSTPQFSNRAEAQTQSAEQTQKKSIWTKIVDWFNAIPRQPLTEQDQAAKLARDGKYEEALTIYKRLYEKNTNNPGIVSDYIAVLGWAGQNKESIELYEKTAFKKPNYVLASVGHSYRQLNETDKALAVYRTGQQDYPNDVVFIEGEARCLADKGELDNALAKVSEDLSKNGDRPEIVEAKRDILESILRRDQQKAVEMARAKRYPEALAMLQDMHSMYPDDVSITRDYLAVLDWAGKHDEQVVSLFKSLPEGDQPDYVLVAAAHAYRKIKQPDMALAIYQQGLSKYPDNVGFAEGEIRTLIETGRREEALARANENLRVYGERKQIVDIKKNILRTTPKAAKKKAS
ncbi:MAG: tetratricopeptide repeat protein [Alphaproteobacteria bacterium]